MRHLKEGRKLKRTASHRRALLRNMVSSLFTYEKIETTDAKAKELKKFADRMITWGKRGDLHARRQSLRLISDRKVVHKLFDDIAPRFRERNGGYTRIIKTGRRKGDCAPMSVIELIPKDEKKSRSREKKKEGKAKPEK